ncbi:MAG: hypothetical protein C0616_00810 [Desulfuromonas sp.]|nr:MAG: hypothetical protein C0616_00810 [Desulfuromonas sp.]
MKRSIAKDFSFLSSLFILLSAILIGSLLAAVDYRRYVEESQDMHDRLLAERKHQLEDRVRQAVEFINFYREQAEERLKATIKDRTYEACAIASGLVAKYRDRFDSATMRDLVRDSLRQIRFNDGRGYVFAINVDGVVELNADKPHFEGENFNNIQDRNGNFVVRDMFELAAREGEGFSSYLWSKPGSAGNGHLKFAFVKFLPELDWVIGTGDYLEDVERDLQQEVIQNLVHHEPEGEHYLFAATWDGDVLVGPGAGKNMFGIKDANGMSVVQELIARAKLGGGFVQYVMPPVDGYSSVPKLSYVEGIPEWRWYVGAGESLENIEVELVELQRDFATGLLSKVSYIALATLAALLLNLGIARYVIARLRKQTESFVGFFQQAAESPVTLDLDALVHDEFRRIGAAANTMLNDRNQALAAFRESEQRFRLAFETIPDPVVLARLQDGGIVDVNRAFEETTGITKADALGKNSAEIGVWVNPEMRQIFRCRLQDDGEVINLEEAFRVKDGGVRTCSLSAKVFTIRDVPHILIIVRDITAEKQVENALRDMDRIKSEFISTAAHELRTPLAAMMGYTELLKDPSMVDSVSDAQRDGFLEEIYDRGEALSRIIDDLLDISRIESGVPIELNREPVDLTELLGKSIRLFRAQSDSHSFHLDMADDIGLDTIKVDRYRINQVLENLLSNAVKYSAAGSEVRVGCRKVDGSIEISVADQGIGMSPEEMSRVFDKFYRADSSDTAVSGLGLGMSIAKQIVESHQGRIWVESKKGEGSVFRFSLSA